MLVMIGKMTTAIMAEAYTLGSAGATGTDFFSIFKTPLICLGAGFAATQLMFKSLSIINDVFGA